MKILGVRITFKRIAAVFIVLFLLGVVVVALGGGGSNSSSTISTSPTAAPTAAAAAPSAASSATPPSSFDPVLAKMEPTLKAEYGAANVTQEAAAIRVDVTYENGTNTLAVIDNRGASEASASVNFLSGQDISNGYVNSPGLTTNFGLQAATVALGHAPSEVKDIFVKGTGNNAGMNEEYIQYDSLYIDVYYTAGA
jgi:hypothetical protein